MMKSILKEYLDLADDEKNTLWKTGTFIFDTNVLLNLYRYSKRTREALFNALENLQERIWLPYHIIEEFYARRCETIYEAITDYDSVLKLIDKIIKECQSSLRMQETEINDLRELTKEWLAKEKKNNILVNNPSSDAILNHLFELYEKKIGNNFDFKILEEIKKEGSIRYDNKIPPGYEDAKKINGSYDNNAFGDLIIWKQILEYAKESNKNVIYITNDAKEDWWYITHGRTIGPRYELKKEFMDITSKSFLMYSMDNFLSIYNEKYNVNTDQSILDEISKNTFRLNSFNTFNHILKQKVMELSLLEEDISRHENYNNYLEVDIDDNERRRSLIIESNKLRSDIEALKKQYPSFNSIIS